MHQHWMALQPAINAFRQQLIWRGNQLGHDDHNADDRPQMPCFDVGPHCYSPSVSSSA